MRAGADGGEKQKKMCCFHWLAPKEFVSVTLENGDGNFGKKGPVFELNHKKLKSNGKRPSITLFYGISGVPRWKGWWKYL